MTTKTKTKIPPHVQVKLTDILEELKIYCKTDKTLREVIDGEDDSKAARAVLDGQDGDEIIWSLGYLNALADVCKCEPSELV
jgi:hypothetical protein